MGVSLTLQEWTAVLQCLLSHPSKPDAQSMFCAQVTGVASPCTMTAMSQWTVGVSLQSST